MRLSEIAPNPPKKISPLMSKLIVVSDQLKTDADKMGPDEAWTVDNLLQYFQMYDIILDKEDLYNMIKKPPLNHIIDNIKGDAIVFKGDEISGGEPEKDKNKEVVKQMAKKALK